MEAKPLVTWYLVAHNGQVSDIKLQIQILSTLIL